MTQSGLTQVLEPNEIEMKAIGNDRRFLEKRGSEPLGRLALGQIKKERSSNGKERGDGGRGEGKRRDIGQNIQIERSGHVGMNGRGSGTAGAAQIEDAKAVKVSTMGESLH